LVGRGDCERGRASAHCFAGFAGCGALPAMRLGLREVDERRRACERPFFQARRSPAKGLIG
jgi:hypothetical protein